ncbi:hypothetical protein bthur0001_52130 [Bacillus thuringiensis serovar tochigiensis BGSC 4Y1]|nr:hypothetical protein bthur0001_52130 [Bacillus thuringiensis serovar tochigiensis BGSC 4Y1]
MVGGFASSYEAKSASMSEAPALSYSERAASAFKIKKTKTGSCKMKLALL